MHSRSSSTGGGLIFGLILIGLALAVGPFVIPGALATMGRATAIGVAAFGTFLLILGAIIAIVTRLYHKASSNEAFVRTGQGGRKCIIDQGMLVVPVLHNITPVSLETMRLDVRRVEKDALITGDNLRVDVEAEFYIKVARDEGDIIAAATSLGDRSVNADTVKELVEQKLVSALRTVAATKTLSELHTKRDDFADSVQRIVEQDLKHNGLTLESTTVSRLDQTPLDAMRDESNVFDAQGSKTIAAIVSAQRVERNQIEREADQRVKQQDVTTQKFVYEQEVERSRAEASQFVHIKQAQAEAKQKADTFNFEQERMAGVAGIKKEEAIKIADVERQKALEVANEQREQAQQIAEIDRNRTVEISSREKEIAVSQKERERAAADAERFAAEAAREEQRQAVQTVEVTATAERDKQRAIIDEQASIEQARLRRQMEADVEAYAMVKDAEAERESAARRAEAVRVGAEAARDSKVLEAAGQRAVQTVPVEVEREKVDVERARVEVKEKDLEIQAKHQEIAKDLQIALAHIAADKDMRIAEAQALASAMSKANMTIFGDPNTFSQMTNSFYKGQQVSRTIDGFMDSVSPEVKDATLAAMGNIGEVGADLIKRFTGKDVSPDEVESVLQSGTAKNGAAKNGSASGQPDGTPPRSGDAPKQ